MSMFYTIYTHKAQALWSMELKMVKAHAICSVPKKAIPLNDIIFDIFCQ